LKLSPSTKEQNVSFVDSADLNCTVVDSVIDSTRTLQDTHDAELANFFSRPLKISEIEWSIGGTVFVQFNPWSLYFENPRVANRIANFNLLIAKLHLKFVINGNGFMYSRALASYLPFHNWDALTERSAIFPNDLVQESQMPHVFLNPTTSQAGEMILPFVWPYNSVYIPESEWNDMGEVTVRSFETLKHANGAAGVSTISVFAWAEDVSLNVLTSRDPDTMLPQSGSEVDEANAKGFISGPATALTNLASALSSAPIIGPYAMATAQMATGVSAVAKLFGYSRPAATVDPEPFRPVASSSLALTTTPDSVAKLTVDDKQELSIDPRIAGLSNNDPLVLKDIAMKESFLTQFDWAISSAPGSLLWNARVEPTTFAFDGLSKFHFPACCVAALPFKYWSGTMKFRFQIMSSAYHKGRLKITYDPNWVANEEFNTMYTRVVDISAETDFTVEVSNGQDVTLIDHHIPGVDSVTQLYSTTRYISKEEGNGVIAVSILNELTTPNSTINNDVTVNVFVSMGDDFEVFVPDDTHETFVYKPQSGEENPDSFQAEQDTAESPNVASIGPTIDPMTNISKVYTGESIKSFRQLLKRYQLHTAVAHVAAGQQRFLIRQANMPYLRGDVAGAIHTTAAAAPYTYCNTMLLHWVTNCYSAWRGGIRYKVVPKGSMSKDARILNLEVERGPPETGNQYSLTSAAWRTYANQAAGGEGVIQGVTNQTTTGTKGKAYAIDYINPILDWEVPYYSHLRFTPGKIEDYTTAATFPEQRLPHFNLDIQANGNTTTAYDMYAAAAEDFTTYFWTGSPPMYYEASPPAA